MKRAFPLILLVALSTGCLEQNRTHRLFVEPDGSTSWTVLEDDIRSTEDDVRDRAREEAEFLREARSRDYAVARALRQLGGGPVRTSILRDQAPFVVWTEASFPSAADALAGLFNEIGARTSARFETDGSRRMLELLVREPEENDRGEDAEHDEDVEEIVSVLFPDEDRFHLVLTRGKVLDAVGFDVTDDRRSVTLILDEERFTRDEDGRVVFRVVWEVPADAS